MLRIVTEDSFHTERDNRVNNTHFTFRDENDSLVRQPINTCKEWNMFMRFLRKRGKKYIIISQFDPYFKTLEKNRLSESPEEAYKRSRYLAKNGFYLTNIRTFFIINGVKIPCLVRIDDHTMNFRNTENNNPEYQCFICILLDDKGRLFDNKGSKKDIVTFESRLISKSIEDVDKVANFFNLIYSKKQNSFTFDDLRSLLGNVTANTSINGEVNLNVDEQQWKAVLDNVVNDINKERIAAQKEKEAMKLEKEKNKIPIITSVKYDDIKNSIKTEDIFKKTYQTFIYNGVKYASSDGLKTAYKVKTNGSVSKAEKVDIIRNPTIKKADYKNNLIDFKNIDGKEWMLFDYNGDEYVTQDEKTAYKLENGKITNQTILIEKKQRRRKLIKLTEDQYRLVRQLFLS